MGRYPKPPILERIPVTGHALIEASAGTGKTYTIEHLILDLLLSGACRIEEILVVTFTERATTELRERVRRMIERIWSEEAYEPAAGDAFWEVDEKARR